jgi:hypothetical protein
MDNVSFNCIYNGNKYSCDLISSENISKIREDVKCCGFYGHLIEGNYIFYMRSGSDGFFVCLEPNSDGFILLEN